MLGCFAHLTFSTAMINPTRRLSRRAIPRGSMTFQAGKFKQAALAHLSRRLPALVVRPTAASQAGRLAGEFLSPLHDHVAVLRIQFDQAPLDLLEQLGLDGTDGIGVGAEV